MDLSVDEMGIGEEDEERLWDQSLRRAIRSEQRKIIDDIHSK